MLQGWTAGVVGILLFCFAQIALCQEVIRFEGDKVIVSNESVINIEQLKSEKQRLEGAIAAETKALETINIVIAQYEAQNPKEEIKVMVVEKEATPSPEIVRLRTLLGNK